MKTFARKIVHGMIWAVVVCSFTAAALWLHPTGPAVGVGNR